MLLLLLQNLQGFSLKKIQMDPRWTPCAELTLGSFSYLRIIWNLNTKLAAQGHDWALALGHTCKSMTCACTGGVGHPWGRQDIIYTSCTCSHSILYTASTASSTKYCCPQSDSQIRRWSLLFGGLLQPPSGCHFTGYVLQCYLICMKMQG